MANHERFLRETYKPLAPMGETTVFVSGLDLLRQQNLFPTGNRSSRKTSHGKEITTARLEVGKLEKEFGAEDYKDPYAEAVKDFQSLESK